MSSPSSIQQNGNALPFANSATIVRANQKDAYFESSLRSQIQDAFQIFKGQRFINKYPEEITVATKSMYLILTTLAGYRTLGEEYVDLLYINRSGKRFPGLFRRLGFIVSYALAPYIISRIVKKFKLYSSENERNKVKKWFIDVFSSYTSVLDTMMNLHVAMFYFQGSYYSLSKRLFGMRYIFGHNKDLNKMAKNSNYSLLGLIILLQFVVKGLIKFKAYTDQTNLDSSIIVDHEDDGTYKRISQIKVSANEVDLADDSQLPYIPEASRNCILCLSPMVNPSAANCGHLFCWECIVDWVRENPECPLCRTSCVEQNLLPLK